MGLLLWPLLGGWPQAAVMLEGRDAALLFGISCSSFCAQLLMTRAFQLLPAARAASLSFLGVVYSHALVSATCGVRTYQLVLQGRENLHLVDATKGCACRHVHTSTVTQ